jgi:hypothetical protein
MSRLTRIVATITLTFVSAIYLHAQNTIQPKEIKLKGTYTHSPTNTSFEEFIEDFKRAGVYTFDKTKHNIGVTYEKRTDASLTTLSIHLYPAGSGTEDRLRNEYISSVKSFANATIKEIGLNQYPAFYTSNGYKINGFTAQFEDTQAQLTVFECGKWFFKIIINSDVLDSVGMNSLRKQVLDKFKPTHLVEKDPLNWKADVQFAPSAFRDSLMLGSTMGSAFKKLEWANKNVDSLERASGFPSLHLDIHVASLKEFTAFEKRVKVAKKQQSTIEYLSQLNQLIEAGYLEEFVMEQFDMIMIVPQEIRLEFDSYKKWKTTHLIDIDLNKKLYLISYDDRKK